jgi:signal transduction histidine kinase
MPTSPVIRSEATRTPVSGVLRILGLVAIYLSTFAQLGRALVLLEGRAPWSWYLVLGAVYLIVCTLLLLRPPARLWLLHGALAAECVLVLAMLSVEPDLDFITGLFVPLAFLAAFLFAGRTVWVWVAVLAVLTSGSLMLFLGPLSGLSLGLTSVAFEVVFGAVVVAAREIEAARRESQVMLHELETTHDQLKAYSEQAGELAAMEERDRVARGLNDSVAQTLAGILTNTRSAGKALAATAGGTEPRGAGTDRAERTAGAAGHQAAPLLAELQTQTQEALAQMRGLIAELRPKAE